MLPEPKPRAMRQHFIVPAIRSGDISCSEWSNIRCFEHFLYLLNFVDDALYIHARQYSERIFGCCELSSLS